MAAALAGAQPAYDRHIEEAAIRMLQPKLGEIRGPLDLDARNHLFPPLSERVGLRGASGFSAPPAPAGAPEHVTVTDPRTVMPAPAPNGRQPRAEGSILRY
ncbi:hypothetical protein [Hoeflea olei]|nr:hypothetical protein [Hoeflea olei]